MPRGYWKNPEEVKRKISSAGKARWAKISPIETRARRRRIYRNAYRRGLSSEEYLALVSGNCSICGNPAEVVDHDHSTDKVRGGLCQVCNRLLGFVERDIPRITKMLQYIQDWKWNHATSRA